MYYFGGELFTDIGLLSEEAQNYIGKNLCIARGPEHRCKDLV